MTGCKTVFALFAFDEGKFPEDAKPWEYTTDEWWMDHLDETFLRLRRFTQWSGGRPPDYPVISTELRQWQRYSHDPRYAPAIKEMVAQVVTKTKRYAPDALITPYAHGQFNFGRDGWRYRNHPWPKGMPWPCVVAQLYEPKHALMLSATAAKSWEYAQEQGVPERRPLVFGSPGIGPLDLAEGGPGPKPGTLLRRVRIGTLSALRNSEEPVQLSLRFAYARVGWEIDQTVARQDPQLTCSTHATRHMSRSRRIRIDEVETILATEKVAGSGFVAIAPAMIDVRAVDRLDNLPCSQVPTFLEVALQHGGR